MPGGEHDVQIAHGLPGQYLEKADARRRGSQQVHIVHDQHGGSGKVEALQQFQRRIASGRVIGREMLLGVSASTLAEAVSAARDGADYLGVGAMYATATKDDACIVTMDALRQIRQAVSLPIVIIGGINEQTAPHFRDTGVDGLAVVSAIVAKEDIEGAARTLIRRFRG